MTKIITMFAMALMASSAFGSILTTNPGTTVIEGITVAKDGAVALKGQSIPISLIGAGLRLKKVAVVNVKVYVAELFSTDASKFVRTDAGALNSLDDSRTTVIRLNFIRTVDAATVQQSFVDALNSNPVAVNDVSIAAFLVAVKSGGDATTGKSMTIALEKNADNTESVFYEDTNGKVTEVDGAQGFSKKLMSIWLGTPDDSGLANLKEALIKGL